MKMKNFKIFVRKLPLMFYKAKKLINIATGTSIIACCYPINFVKVLGNMLKKF